MNLQPSGEAISQVFSTSIANSKTNQWKESVSYRSDLAVLCPQMSTNTQPQMASKELRISIDLLTNVCFTKGPLWACKSADRNLPVTGDYLDGDSLSAVVATTLPVYAPVSRHGCPIHFVTLHVHLNHHTRSSHVRDCHQVQIAISVQSESNSSLFLARNSAYTSRFIRNGAVASTRKRR